MSAREDAWLFVRVCRDLEKRLRSVDEYEVLKSSGLLRQLLLDDAPLVHRANKNYKLDIEFEITDFQPPTSDQRKILLWNIADGLDPQTCRPGRGNRKVRLEDFLRLVVLRSGDTSFTIKDLIKFEANVMGGIHAGSPRTETEQHLRMITDMYSIQGIPGCLRQLKAIARVVLKAVDPLKVRVQADLAS